jgi:hypothetical protein
MKILGWIIVIPVVLFVLLIVARVAFCGPNSSDVKVMKPMAEKISDYIVKNGIPESLEDIPNLPYELKDCKKIVKGTELCSYSTLFIVDASKFWNTFRIDIKNKHSQTGIYYELEFDKEKQIWRKKQNASYSSKTSGICSPMKQ